MKKIIALVLSCLVCAACFSIFASAEEYGVASLLPNPDGEMTTEGCDVVVNANGSVTITLTADKGKVKMLYKDGDTILEEPYSEIANYPYVAYWYDDTNVEKFEAHAHYDRKDKTADLYLSGMQANPNFYEAGDKDSKYGVWSLYDYLVKKGADYVEGDYAILKFFDIEYELNGKVGDSVTIYYFGTMKDIPEGFGTDAPETPSEDPSDDPIVEPSEAPSEASSEEPSTPAESSSAPATSSEKPTEPTSDNGIVALAVIAAIAVAGAVVVKKVR